MLNIELRISNCEVGHAMVQTPGIMTRSIVIGRMVTFATMRNGSEDYTEIPAKWQNGIDSSSYFCESSARCAFCPAVAVAMPYSWLNAIYRWLSLGELPNQPIVGYLARSTSAFYAFFGGLLWCVSFHPNRYRPVIYYLSATIIIFGVILFIVNFVEGLPLYWRICEGPINIIFGVIIFTLSCSVENIKVF